MAPRVGVRTALWRAVRLRCSWCGSRRTFLRSWFGRYARCRTCGLRWRREEGFELGPVVLNTIFTFAALTVAMTIGFVVTYPDVPVWPIVGWGLAVAVVLPIVLYPFTFTLWFGFEVLTHPPETAELVEALAALAADRGVAGDGERAAKKSG